MITIRHERTADFDAREALLDCACGEDRTAKSSERLREGRLPSNGLSFVATDDGQVIGTARLWDISAGPGRPALLLGPLAVDPGWQKLGVGKALMKRALQAARRRGGAATGPCCWSATRRITAGSASRPPRPANCGCRAPMSAIVCSASN